MTVRTLPLRTCAPKRASLLSVVVKAIEIWRQRQALKSLDAHLLRDIGVTQRDAQLEAKRPVWDAPEHWN